MEREQVNLAAIMFTDIVGYTSLTESNEELALELLEEHRKIVRPLISSHNGKEVKTIGDAFLVEFGSAAEATRCALEIQQLLYRFNLDRKPSERILLRIGIHLGDVIHSGKDKDVYGDAVNVASRIEALSEPGGISISRQVYDSIRIRMRDVRFESLGLKELKNVENPIEVFKITMSWGEESRSSSYYSPEDNDDEAQPKSRIVVLPFINIGPDPSDEFFADGLTEELIARLSERKELRVIARTSAMNYKNSRQKKVKEIGRELGAGTIIEGSVRKAGNRVRVSVQVVDAMNEEHLWSSTYDRNLDDIFEIQTDIATKVVDSISSNLGPLMQREIRLPQEKKKEEETKKDVTAYTYFLRARHLMHGESESSVMQALEFFNKAIEEDPSFARAYVGRADCYLSLKDFARLPFVEGAKKAEAEIKIALEIDPGLSEAHATLSYVKYALDEFGPAEQEARKAIELNPSLADAYHALGHLKWIRGQIEEATKLFEIAYKLDPLREEHIQMLGLVYLYGGREEEALKLWSSTEHLFPQSSYAGMIEYYLLKRDYAKAVSYLEKFSFFAGRDSIFTLGLGALIAAYKGERSRAFEFMARIEQSSGHDTIAVTSLGMIYYALGDLDKFFEYMERASEIHALPLGNLVNSPTYANARKDPRFKSLIEKVDLKIERLS